MNVADFFRGLEIIFGISCLVQSIEYLSMLEYLESEPAWSWRLYKLELPHSFEYFKQFLNGLFQAKRFKQLLILRFLASIWLIAWGSNAWVTLSLFVCNFLLLFRFRGAFNGGSDFMTLVVLTGFVIEIICQGLGFTRDKAMEACLWYVTIHTLSSYFISGWIKIKSQSWRRGEALALFMDDGLFGPLPVDSIFWIPRFARWSSWAFIAWEACAPLVLISREIASLYCLLAFVFHLLVFWFFGLNRFFWAWLSAFPALIFCAGQLFSA